jgi:hypothetical protein
MPRSNYERGQPQLIHTPFLSPKSAPGENYKDTHRKSLLITLNDACRFTAVQCMCIFCKSLYHLICTGIILNMAVLLNPILLNPVLFNSG